MITVKIDTEDIKKTENFLNSLGDQAVNSMKRVLKRVGDGVKTDAVREVPKHYNVKGHQVRKTFTVVYANQELLIETKGYKIPLFQLGPNPSSITKKKPPVGISVKVRGGRKTIKESFIAKMPTGHIGVFQRKKGDWGRRGNKKLERIEELFGLSIPEMVCNKHIVKEIKDGARKRFSKNLDHEINRTLEKLGAR